MLTLFQRKPRPAQTKKDVLYWLSMGKRVPEIAILCNLTEPQVTRIVRQLKDELDARENTLLIRRGFESNLLQRELPL